ncbi:metal ABC transporter ATP-binding protein [Rufibacter hautae]|uniref:Metal ABC transporter ATP-binding protein n=1 Tax=Rufibacter hautae TaxID=2595005 RepID=A0A5B6TFJ1_9BACT|nr:metal ABC transporter ATP-binding protein [Rufibacter hautae]KAA3438050.1 metal ABC transporter ATP-binding protein [Rufibacter hautae]
MIQHVTNPVLEVHDLTVSYQRKPVLWDVDLTLPQQALVGIIGPNGAGKSTLIKAIMGLLPLNSGFVELFGKPLEEVRKRVSYVPQRESVDWDFPASALDVAMMGTYGQLGLFRRPGSREKKLAMEALEKVGMQDFANRQISQLSGGQQQRVFLSRALAQDADLYLMDEPFAGVDIATETAIIELLRLMRDNGKTVVVVHHDLQSAQDYFDWIILLNMRLVASGPTEETLTPPLLEKTYGGRLTELSRVSELLQKKQFPIRETKPTRK